MNKKYLETVMGLLMLLIMGLLAGYGLEGSSVGAIPEPESKIVVIDSGHGGMDPGKVGVNNALEKDINLSIALRLRDLLEEQGITVVLTRDTDMGHYKKSDSNKKIADLNERCRIIEKSEADITISIHQNSYHDSSVRGSQIFYYKESKDGLKLAETLQTSFESVKEIKSRGVKANDNYYLLLNVSCPVVIVECGFLSNWEDSELLVKEDYQNKIAEILCDGTLDYFALQK